MRFPGDSDRVAILGRSGSGKTTAEIWHLSGKDFRASPWLIVNTKDDELINQIAQIEGVQTIGLNETPGDQGLYIVNPRPSEQVELDALFQRIWEKQNCGIAIDEGYAIKKTDWFNACLTSGRTRKIPMIVGSQRPKKISLFVFSEASYMQVFDLTNYDDRKEVSRWIPFDPATRLPNHYSLWYDVKHNSVTKLSPVPPADKILNSFNRFFETSPNVSDRVPPSPPEFRASRGKLVV